MDPHVVSEDFQNPSRVSERAAMLPEGHLRSDLMEAAHWLGEFNRENSVRERDDARVLGVVAVAPGDDGNLAVSLPQLLRQIAELPGSRRGDILVGLNHGASCPRTTTILESIDDVAVIPLRTRTRPSMLEASVVVPQEGSENPYFIPQAATTEHRVFLIHQPAAEVREVSAGKLRALSDLYTFVIANRLMSNWIPPRFAIAFDSESQFLPVEKDRLVTQNGNGLIPLFEELDQGRLGFIGAHWKLAYFRDRNGLSTPALDLPLHPISHFFDRMFGETGFRFLPGPGTVGDTALLTAFGLVAAKYPRARQEDMLITLLAENGGIPWDLSPAAHVLNAIDGNNAFDAHDAMGQARRWLRGIYALHTHYGEEHMLPIANANLFLDDKLEPFRRVMDELQLDEVLQRIVIESLQDTARRARESGEQIDDHSMGAGWRDLRSD